MCGKLPAPLGALAAVLALTSCVDPGPLAEPEAGVRHAPDSFAAYMEGEWICQPQGLRNPDIELGSFRLALRLAPQLEQLHLSVKEMTWRAFWDEGKEDYSGDWAVQGSTAAIGTPLGQASIEDLPETAADASEPVLLDFGNQTAVTVQTVDGGTFRLVGDGDVALCSRK